MTKLKVVDLFAGAGGLSLGFKKAGYDICSHIEIDERCCETIEANASSTEQIFNVDITDHKSYLKNLKTSIGGNLDGIIGGPPCQAYSIAGRVQDEHNMENDYRNYLFEN